MKMKRILSIALTLMLLLSLLPEMGLTAYAETPLTTITATGIEQASYSTANVATVSFSYTANGSLSYTNNGTTATWGWWGYGWSATVNAAEGYTITKCVFYDDKDRTATDSEAPFVVATTEEDKTPQVNGTPILANTSKGITKIEVYGYVTPATSYSVTITAGDNMTKTTGSGDAEQTGLTGAMTDVVYTADNGYYFPTDYSVAEVSGIKVTRDSYTQITVSGTPTADATIALTAPTAKTTPDAPTATATDCTTADNNDGKLTGVTTAMEYKKSDAADWTVGTGSDITGLVPGTYYVRVKATDTTNASTNQELTIKGFISYTVTFKVVNGKWNEGEGDAATADKTVTLTGHDGDTLKLTADQIPAVGTKPSDTYKAGSWDVTPSTETEITAATTYTYTYVAKEAAVVTKAPEGKTLTYNGQAQELVTAGTATGGEMQYALGNATEATQPYTTSIPAKTDAGTYYVWYMAKGDNDHLDSATKCVSVVIKKESVKPEVPTDKLVYNGKDQPLVEAGKAEGGTLLYAIGADGKTAPTEGWSETVPTGKNAGTYFVWYKVKGDANHNDTDPKCVEATIAKKGLTVTADAKSKTQGEADPALTYTAEGLVGSDAITGALSREAGEDPGTYAINLGTLTAGDNYVITFVPATLTINKAPAPDPGPAPAPAPAPAPSSGGGGGYYGGGAIQNQRRDAYSDMIGAAATNFWGSSPERIRNIELACEKLDGIVLQPGEVFSFNEAVGGLTAEDGFAVAPVNPDDEATAEMGGGVSQVASTLYTGSLFALLETVERGNHPFAVPFIQPGTDAYVANADNGSGPDLKFRNTRGEPIRISAKTRVDEAKQVREIVIELQSALGSSDYMPFRFDNTWGGDQNAFLTATPYDLTRPGYRILLTHEEQAFTDDKGAGIRTLTHRKILDAAGMLVRDEILNNKLPDGSYAMDTYYLG